MHNQFERLQYENPDLWSPARWSEFSMDNFRANRVLELMPKGIKSVLDVGSGNGLLYKVNQGKYQIISLDRSFAALQQAGGVCFQANAFELPFVSASFDAIVSMEMLEHLPAPKYHASLEELARVSRKNIFITVPYEENLTYSQITCPQCSSRFHPYYHVRSFNEGALRKLLIDHGWQCLYLEPVGIIRTRRLQAIWKLVRLYFHRRGANFPWYATCPLCGYKRPQTNSSTSLDVLTTPAYLTKKLFSSLWPTRPAHIWWLAIYAR